MLTSLQLVFDSCVEGRPLTWEIVVFLYAATGLIKKTAWRATLPAMAGIPRSRGAALAPVPPTIGHDGEGHLPLILYLRIVRSCLETFMDKAALVQLFFDVACRVQHTHHWRWHPPIPHRPLKLKGSVQTSRCRGTVPWFVSNEFVLHYCDYFWLTNSFKLINLSHESTRICAPYGRYWFL